MFLFSDTVCIRFYCYANFLSLNIQQISFEGEKMKALFIVLMMILFNPNTQAGDKGGNGELIVNISQDPQKPKWVIYEHALNLSICQTFVGIESLPLTNNENDMCERDYRVHFEKWIEIIKKPLPNMAKRILEVARKADFIFINNEIALRYKEYNGPITFQEEKKLAIQAGNNIYISLPNMDLISDTEEMSKESQQGFALIHEMLNLIYPDLEPINRIDIGKALMKLDSNNVDIGEVLYLIHKAGITDRGASKSAIWQDELPLKTKMKFYQYLVSRHRIDVIPQIEKYDMILQSFYKTYLRYWQGESLKDIFMTSSDNNQIGEEIHKLFHSWFYMFHILYPNDFMMQKTLANEADFLKSFFADEFLDILLQKKLLVLNHAALESLITAYYRNKHYSYSDDQLINYLYQRLEAICLKQIPQTSSSYQASDLDKKGYLACKDIDTQLKQIFYFYYGTSWIDEGKTAAVFLSGFEKTIQDVVSIQKEVESITPQLRNFIEKKDLVGFRSLYRSIDKILKEIKEEIPKLEKEHNELFPLIAKYSSELEDLGNNQIKNIKAKLQEQSDKLYELLSEIKPYACSYDLGYKCYYSQYVFDSDYSVERLILYHPLYVKDLKTNAIYFRKSVTEGRFYGKKLVCVENCKNVSRKIKFDDVFPSLHGYGPLVDRRSSFKID